MKICFLPLLLVAFLSLILPAENLYGQDRSASQTASGEKEKEPLEPIPDEYANLDVAGMIDIQQKKDLETKRAQLIELIWGKAGLPKKFPEDIREGFIPREFRKIENLESGARIRVRMDWSLMSQMYLLRPERSNDEYFIYHHGHGDKLESARPTIEALVGEGYTVLIVSMPLFGPNPKPFVDHPLLGAITIEKHDQIQYLRPKTGNPLKYFLEPVIVALNYAQTQDYQAYHMIGLSGGGWATTLCAAIDTRITHSYPVAGTFPMYLRWYKKKHWGDWEQSSSEIYSKVNYLELYVLGACGSEKKRSQMQILNRYDTCCFFGTMYRTYEKPVRERAASLQGTYSVLLDESHKTHAISPWAMQHVLKDLKQHKK